MYLIQTFSQNGHSLCFLFLQVVFLYFQDSRFLSDKSKRQFTFVLFHQAFPFTLTTPWAAGVSSSANLNANAVFVCLLSGILGLSWAGERD